ncbi:DUF2920 family protein [Alkalihalobacillus sp. AL-G]|uniref:DUF2920 family protein n=1 Tax=Alkalihalobacillus sp. AL-G TaxID=2926399 RepID=UPI00272AF7BA|nr:DUF2920 family protein [Alkalihalobacillus sp. AL-G]WLD93084.1 DUF2920 family protein [Alkalihalobacillus sp. AL-G]
MSEQYSIKIPAHPTIYVGNSDRELRIDFSTPQNGVNAHTGLLILVPGFGGNIDSKIYKKMRELFADKYNMVTIQSDYFGSSYMQEAENFTFPDKQVLQSIFTIEELEKINQDSSVLFNLLSEKNTVLPLQAKLNESLEEYNDMSYMQAIDIISAIEAVKITLNENNLTFDSNRIIGYGHSHGAYLLHLSNILAPSLYSYIVDNSAWLEPVYLSKNRFLYRQLGNSTLAIEFDYLAKNITKNKQDLNLNTLYENFSGTTQILSFQGNDDVLVDHTEKKCMIETIPNSKFILVTEADVDNKKYKSNTHGLDADFLELFSYALEFQSPEKKVAETDLKYVIDFKGVRIDVDYTYGLPVFSFSFK